MVKLFAVMFADKPAPTPTVPGFSGLKKLAVTHACVAPPLVADIVFPEIVILVPAVNAFCLAFNNVVKFVVGV